MVTDMYQIDLNKPVHVYFIGIGGISMSGIAQILIDRNFTVSGSDSKESALTDELVSLGAKVFIGQKASNIESLTSTINVVTYTSAIHPDNPEFAAAKAAGLPMLRRSELLGQIMKHYELPISISGTHGKTTTTSMISKILLEADTDPTLSIGGIFKDINGNTRIGSSKFFVAEACEYTNSFLNLYEKIGIILDIDADHLDFFKDLDDIRHSFKTFAGNIPDDGYLIINGAIDNLNEITSELKCKVITFGIGEGFDYYATEITYDSYANPTYTLVSALDGSKHVVTLSVPGEHNILNSLAAAAAALLCGVKMDTILTALKDYQGTDRRFQRKGEFDGITVVDDYAHHPTEIAATLTAARNFPHKDIWCVFQPHTYTRTKSLLPDFAKALCLADHVVLADIYAARETDNLGISSRTLQAEIKKLGHECYYYPSFEEIEKFLLQNCTKKDLLITMGAGDVYQIGEELLGK